MDLGQRPFKVPGKLGEASLYRACPRDQDIIVAFDGVGWAHEAHRFFQATARPVAQDGAAKALGGGEAEASDAARRIGSAAVARLQYEGRRGKARSFPHMQELSAGLETSDCRHRGGGAGAIAAAQADRRLRPLALRLASTSRPPLVAMRARKPCRRLRTSLDG